jgi:hypothetical protein
MTYTPNQRDGAQGEGDGRLIDLERKMKRGWNTPAPFFRHRNQKDEGQVYFVNIYIFAELLRKRGDII